jgi:hypothetical protein
VKRRYDAVVPMKKIVTGFRQARPFDVAAGRRVVAVTCEPNGAGDGYRYATTLTLEAFDGHTVRSREEGSGKEVPLPIGVFMGESFSLQIEGQPVLILVET